MKLLMFVIAVALQVRQVGEAGPLPDGRGSVRDSNHTCLFRAATIGSGRDELRLIAGERGAELKKTSAPAAVSLPAGAREIAPHTWTHTDEQGKTWTYRRTPFGLVRFEAKADEPPKDDLVDQITAAEQGDSVRFERATPFGPQRWTVKKSEMNDLEKKAWSRAQKAAGKE